jgi:hypothetical protein
VSRILRLVTPPAALLLLAACYNFATPSYHPGDATDLGAAIERNGLTIRSVTPGDSACADAGLIANALHLVVGDPADDADRDIWIYSFRERYWDASKAQVDACQEAYEGAHPGSSVNRVDIPLYRAFGPGWSTDLTQALKAGLNEAAQAGQP